MNNKVKILAITLISGSVGAVAVARSVMGTADNQNIGTESLAIGDLSKNAMPSNGLVSDLQSYKSNLEQN